MARNYESRGDVVTLTSTTGISSGDPVKIGSIVGVAAGDAANGDPVDVQVVGVFRLGKDAALAIDEGDILYLNTGTGLVNKTSGGNTKIGVAVEAVPNPSPDVAVRLNGAF